MKYIIISLLFLITNPVFASVNIRLRGDTAANWVANNYVLVLREPGVETDTGKIKIGDGVTPWNSLPYAAGSSPAPTSIQMTFSSDATLTAQTGSKSKIPTGLSYTTADIGCDVSDTLSATVYTSPSVNGTYTSKGVITLSGAAQSEGVDISSWGTSPAGTWVRIDLTTAGTTAKECTIAIGGVEL